MLTFGTVVLSGSEAYSQQPFVYVAKFVCGRSVNTPNNTAPVANGFYFTAINVHTMLVTEFRKRMSVALPKETAGKVSETFGATLKDNEALEIDCPDILGHLRLSPVPPFVKGFVTIESPRELDVVAVYTASATPTSALVTMEVERVPRR